MHRARDCARTVPDDGGGLYAIGGIKRKVGLKQGNLDAGVAVVLVVALAQQLLLVAGHLHIRIRFLTERPGRRSRHC
jgi:hypothetical protein